MTQRVSKRRDSRASSALRPLSCEQSPLRSADGSALWKSGSTQVLATVHGPVAPRAPHYEQKNAIVSVLVKSGATTKTDEREWEGILTRVLSACVVTDQYPRSIIQVVLQIVATDGSVLSACLHAAVSACLDASIAMKFLPVAATCLIESDGTIRLDPDTAEEDQYGSIVVVVHEDMILATHSTGVHSSMDIILQCVTAAQKMAPAVTSFWRLAVEQKATREAQTLWSC